MWCFWHPDGFLPLHDGPAPDFPVIASILSLGEPVSAYLLSVLVMGLDVGLIEGIGVVMVLATVVLLAKTPRKSNEGENIAPRWKSQN